MCMMMVPFVYGFTNVNWLGAVYGATITGFGLTMIWAIAGYTALKRRYNIMTDLGTDALDSNDMLQTRLKVQEALLTKSQNND